ncbi:hypothetical protein PYCCODRAFT_1428641 [Trametes coccinea BRFM310]|uniref:Uncharacterized protein n=1 Tax=Trametes coccinea (strain BRFM310) TaxID=1353009 RepID=A0A1Y2I8W0_TRAC3|nr:hypothetical protein PYCCODRAFT_1428641 [Trametes coccinea BRFM310]
MSSNPRSYNADDRVRWEQYADAFRDWLAKRGRYPGDPPSGYLEVYKTIQRYAPCPHEYAALVAAELRPALAGPTLSTGPGVTMTTESFTAMLAHQSAMQAQTNALAQQLATARGSGYQGPNARGRGRGAHYGRPARGLSGPRNGRALSDRIDRRNDTSPSGRQRQTRRGRRAPRTRPLSPQPDPQNENQGEGNLPDPDDNHHGNAEAVGDREEVVPREVLQAELPFMEEEPDQFMTVDSEDLIDFEIL